MEKRRRDMQDFLKETLHVPFSALWAKRDRPGSPDLVKGQPPPFALPATKPDVNLSQCFGKHR
jgi:hypothetical protein